MDVTPWNAYIEFAIGLSTLVGIIYSFWRWGLPRIHIMLEKRRRWQDAMNSLPDALAKIASIDVLAARIEKIYHAVLPNNGSSIPDSIARIEAAQAEGRDQRLQLTKDLATVSHTIRANQNANPNVAGFEARPDGRLVAVTKTYTRWTGVEVSDLLGWNWINTVHPDHKQAVRAEFMSAIADVRNTTIRYVMVNLGSGDKEEVEMTLTAIPENTSPCERFVGSIFRVNHADNP